MIDRDETYRNLQRDLRFADADLAMNRTGRMSPRQATRIHRSAFGFSGLFAAFATVALVAFWSDRHATLFSQLIVTLVALFFVRSAIWNAWHQWTLSSVEGIDAWTFDLYRVNRNNQLSLVVPGHVLLLPRASSARVAASLAGRSWTFYALADPISTEWTVLSLEPLSR